MGLDMYMYARNHETGKDTEIGYWRKHNALHGFFDSLVGGIEDTQEVQLTKDNLQEALELSEAVLRKDVKAEKVLPTTAGFFFGSYDYDDWYYLQTQETVEQLRRILKEVNFEENDIIYWAWW